MKRALLILGIAAFVALIVSVVWNTGRGYRSSTFSGPNFHAAHKADSSAVFSKFAGYLDSKGFRSSQSPSEWDSLTGVHSEGVNRISFVKEEEKNVNTHLHVYLSEFHVRTYIKWSVNGSHASGRDAKAGALRLAIEVDDWFATLSEANELPDKLRQKKRRRFECDLEEIAQG